MIQFCKKCVMPVTRPGVPFDSDGVCSACKAYEGRKEVDWDARRQELKALVEKYAVGGNYDCIVPVSGGKDSTFQVLTLLEMGFKPLCVTATTDYLTGIGRKNIENLKNLGVDYIEFTVNPVIRKKINRIALHAVGDISWPEHITIFTVPVRLAIQLKIPLLVWGENPQNEYGGDNQWSGRVRLDRNWLETHGGLNGLAPNDLLGLGFSRKDILQYFYPPAEQVEREGITGVFLGHFVPWDGLRNGVLSSAYGLTCNPRAIEGNLTSYENLDNAQTGIHDYFGYLKFGFGRTAAQASLLVRRGFMTRGQAVRLSAERDGAYPASYMGVPLSAILSDIGMKKSEFDDVCEHYTNWPLFSGKREDGSPKRTNDDNA